MEETNVKLFLFIARRAICPVEHSSNKGLIVSCYALTFERLFSRTTRRPLQNGKCHIPPCIYGMYIHDQGMR